MEKPVETINNQRPFPGLKSFDEKNKSQFGGRDAEIKELFTKVENNGLTVIFGKSGIGKTSLINAGLLPELQKNFYLPIYFRIDFSAEKAPLNQIKDFIVNTLRQKNPDMPGFENRTLWEYFHEVKILDGLVTPVLVLDQFEEVFTLGKDNAPAISELFIELSDLVENRVPLNIQSKNKGKTELMPSYYGEHQYRVILSLREDYLAQLESLGKLMPSIRESRYRVVQMTAVQALDAVLKPAGNLINKEVAISLIKKLPGISDADFDEKAEDSDYVKRLLVEPFLLSLICFQINETRISKGLPVITIDLVNDFDMADVINAYYNAAVGTFENNIRLGIEDTLLTESGYRKLESLEELQLKYGFDDLITQTLIDKRIIRKEQRDGLDYVELIHDVLAPVIKNNRDKRIEEQREIERNESVRRALELYRGRRRKYIFIVAGSIALIILTLFGLWAKKNATEAGQFKQKEFANGLLVVANSISENNTEDSSAALFARMAYKIYKDNNGTNFNAFYKAMYAQLHNTQLTALRVITNSINSEEDDGIVTDRHFKALAVSGNYLYAGHNRGKVYKLNLKNYEDVSQFYDFGVKITSMATSANKEYLAVAGIFPYVAIFNLNRTNDSCIKLNIPNAGGNGKSVMFTPSGNIMLRTDYGLYEWDKNYRLVNWKARKFIRYENGKRSEVPSVVFGKPNFNLPGQKFNGIAVNDENFVVGTDSGVLIVFKDSMVNIKQSDFGNVTALVFDKNMQYIYGGNDVGEFWRLSLKDFTIESGQNQIGRIFSITMSSDGKYVATGSGDGSVGVYETGPDWNQNSILILEQKECDRRKVFSVAFSEDNRLIYAAYDDGTVLNWPANADILAELIKAQVKGNLDYKMWNKYIKPSFEKQYLDNKIDKSYLKKYQ